MTIRAGNRDVFSFQWERAATMRLAIEERRLECRLIVTRDAIRSCHAGCELSFVPVLVTGTAAIVRNGPVEVNIRMTLGAGKLGMLPD